MRDEALSLADRLRQAPSTTTASCARASRASATSSGRPPTRRCVLRDGIRSARSCSTAWPACSPSRCSTRSGRCVPRPRPTPDQAAALPRGRAAPARGVHPAALLAAAVWTRASIRSRSAATWLERSVRRARPRTILAACASSRPRLGVPSSGRTAAARRRVLRSGPRLAILGALPRPSGATGYGIHCGRGAPPDRLRRAGRRPALGRPRLRPDRRPAGRAGQRGLATFWIGFRTRAGAREAGSRSRPGRGGVRRRTTIRSASASES